MNFNYSKLKNDITTITFEEVVLLDNNNLYKTKINIHKNTLISLF